MTTIPAIFLIALLISIVLCSRYVGRGLFVRVKKDFYVLEENWRRLSEKDLFRLANHLQVPSYVSLGSALSFYGVSTQVRRNRVESVALRIWTSTTSAFPLRSLKGC